MESDKPGPTEGEHQDAAPSAANHDTAPVETSPADAASAPSDDAPGEAAASGEAPPATSAPSDEAPAEAAASGEAPPVTSAPSDETPAEAAASESEPPAEAATSAESASSEDAPAEDAAAPAADVAPEPEPPPPPPPHITSILPAHGPMRGGTRVEIGGQHFVEGCVVRIGDDDVAVTFESDTLLVVSSPERASFGFADVRVTNPGGANEVRVHGFQYDTPPLPEFVKPDTLGVRGGTVRVFGEAFAPGVVVTLGGMPVPVVFKAEDCLELTIPAASPGPADLTITNPDGQHAVLKGKLTFSEGPVIEAVSPVYGPPIGGTRVTVSGRGFVRGCTVTLFGAHAPAVTLESGRRLSFVTPPHEPGEGSIRVTNPDGLFSVLEAAFDFRTAPPPAVTKLSPDRAWVSGGSRVLVSGGAFVEGCTATIAGTSAATTWKNAGLLEVMVPAGAQLGPTDLVVTNPDGQTAASPFVYERVPTPPKLISVTPARGPTHGNVTVVFVGDNFDEDTVVRIAEVRTTTKLLSKTELEVLVPPRPGEGAVAIELISGDGIVVRSEEAFYYNDRPPPKITGVAPPQGPMSGNTRVSIEGEGFSQDCFVRIGRERPKTITIRGPNLIEIVTPPCKITGFVDIEVGTNATGSSVAKNVFRFIALPAPTIDSVAPSRGSVNGGTEIGISGKNFAADAIVSIGGKQVKYKLISPDLIEAKTPPGDDGQMVDVSVKHLDGKEAVVRRAFAYDARYKQ